MAKLTQAQVEQWIAQNGGPQGVQYSVEQKQIRNPSADIAEQTLNPYVSIEVEVWRNAKTGAELSARRGADGDFEQIENRGADPNRPATTGATAQAQPPETKDEGGRRYQWKPNPGGPNAGGVWEDVGPAPLTPAERAAQQDNKPQYITAQDGTVYEVAPGKPPRAIIQGAKPGQIVNVGGGKLVRVGNDGRAEVVYDDPSAGTEVKQDKDGNWVKIGRDGTVTAIQVQGQLREGVGPARPNIIVGHATAALRAYGDQLDAEVSAGRITPAERKRRWDEAVSLAPLAINEATLAQNAEQSNLNASVQLSNNRLSNSTSGFNAALSAVNDLNGKLPTGSTLGGEAFIALLGMQLMQAERAGANDVRWPSRSPEGASLGAAASATTGATSTAIGNLVTPPTPPQPAAAGPPNAIGAGAVPSAIAPPAAAAPLLAPPPPETGQMPAAPVSQAPAPQDDFAVLKQYTQPTPLQTGQVAQGQAPPMPDVGMPTALLRSQAAMTPFWRMTPQEYEQYKAAGIPEEVIRSAGRAVA